MTKKLMASGLLFLLILTGFSCSKENPKNNIEIKTLSAQKEEVEKKETDTAKQKSSKESPIVTFIELGSVNCVPCKMMKPVMEKVEKKYSNKVKVVFYDVWTEEDSDKAEKFGIRAIPTQIFLNSDGEEYYRHTGYFPFEELEAILKQGGVK